MFDRLRGYFKINQVNNCHALLEEAKKSGSNDQICLQLINVGKAYLNMNDYSDSIKYFSQCLELSERMNIKMAIAGSSAGLCMAYIGKDEYNTKVLDYAQKYLDVSEELGNKDNINAARQLVAVISKKII